MNDKIYFRRTGNPFVDAGLYILSIQLRCPIEKITPDKISPLIEPLTDLYLTKQWSKNIQSIFPNSKLINPSIKDKKKNYMEFLESLIASIEPLNGNHGACVACGRKTTDKYTKSQIPMIGSKKLINFFSYGSHGADFCSACTLAIQFSPLFYFNGGGRFFLLHSNSNEFMAQWAYQCNQKMQINRAAGVYDEGYRSPINGLFYVTQDVIKDLPNYQDKTSVQLYDFSNYNQNPNLNLYFLPDHVFSFLLKLQHKGLDKEWYEVKCRGYLIKQNESYNNEKHKNRTNLVYKNLLENKSIHRFFVDHRKMKAIGSWPLLELYLLEVRKIYMERIEAVKKLSKDIASYILSANDEKAFKKFLRTKNYQTFRSAILYVIQKRIYLTDEPLIDIDTYMSHIVPDIKMWRESRDLILFGLYSELHAWIKEREEMKESEIELEEA